MALVTRKFKEDFETWANHQVDTRRWSAAEIDEFTDMLRRELTLGPDQLRAGLVVLIDGMEIPAAIESHEERYRLWADFLDAEAEAIRALKAKHGRKHQ